MTAPAPHPIRTARQRAEYRLHQMEQLRTPKMERFRDIEAFVTPYSTNVDLTAKRYEDQALNVLDETVFYCRVTLQAFLHSGMTNPSQRWSQWTLPDPDLAESAAAKEYLHTLNDRRYQLLARSNFYEVMTWVYGEWPAFGTAVVLIEEDEQDVFSYIPFGIGSYALADDLRGTCCGVSRRLWMTVDQLLERFAPKDANGRPDTSNLSRFSRTVQDAVRNQRWLEKVEVAHLVYKNDDYRPTSDNPEYFAYASLYWEWNERGEQDSGGFLAKEGYREWPFMVFRWGRIPGDPWGADAPGILTLAANKGLQQMKSDQLMAIEVQVKPPVVVPTGLTTASILPAAKNSVDTRTGQAIGPLVKTEPEAIERIGIAMDEERERIMALWWTRLILSNIGSPMARREKTAREVEEISQEKFLVLGRVVEKAKEAFDTAFAREFAIMARRGFLPEPIADLAGESITLQYTSFLAIAQGQIGLQRIENFGLMMAQMAKLTEDPAFRLKVDYAQYIDEVANLAGVPPRVIRSDEDVEQMQAAAAAAQEEARRAEVDAMRAKTVKDLGTTPATGDTALSALSQVAGPGGIPSSASGLVS